jgi:hypothetical protein
MTMAMRHGPGNVPYGVVDFPDQEGEGDDGSIGHHGKRQRVKKSRCSSASLGEEWNKKGGVPFPADKDGKGEYQKGEHQEYGEDRRRPAGDLEPDDIEVATEQYGDDGDGNL